MNVVYGFDPSLTHFGYAVLDTAHVAAGYDMPTRWLSCGAFVTAPDAGADTRTEDLARRCEYLARQLLELIGRHGEPSAICCEALALPWGKTSMQTVSTLGRVRGLVDVLAAQHRVQVQEVTPQTLKRLVAGHAKASKEAVKKAVVASCPELGALLAKLKPGSVEHAADAAAAILAAQRKGTP